MKKPNARTIGAVERERERDTFLTDKINLRTSYMLALGINVYKTDQLII